MSGNHSGQRPERQADEPVACELTLFVNGASRLSRRAVGDVHAMCEQHLAGHYRLEVVDINSDVHAMTSDRVQAVPTLIKRLPAPRRRIVGDLSDSRRVLAALQLEPEIGVADGEPE